jgi:hypothetical protein
MGRTKHSGQMSRETLTRPRLGKDKENKFMKLSMISRGALSGLALLLATSAFAANKPNKGSFELSETLTVSGHELRAGQYKVTWEGTGPDVEAMILSEGKLVATVPAHVTDFGQTQRRNAIGSSKNGDGTESLTEIDFAGNKYALSFDNGSVESTSAGSQ